MSQNKFLPGIRGVGSHTQSGMIHSLLSPYPNDIPVLITEFLDLNRIPKTTITDRLFNIAQTMNLLEPDSATNSTSGTPLYNIGINNLNQLYIKTETEDDTLAGPNPPAILVDTNGDVYIGGQTSSQQTGYLYVFNSDFVPAPAPRKTAMLDATGNWKDPTNPANFRYDNIFFGAGIPGPGQSWDWNPVITPLLPIPNNQSIVNQSAFPGSVEPGFKTFAAPGTKLPVNCNISGIFEPTTDIKGANLNNVVHTFNNVPIDTNFTASYTFTVGIVRRVNTGAGGTFYVEASQDINIPFRGGYLGHAVSFSCDFSFEMENVDPATGQPQDYVPFFNHNGVELPASDAFLQYKRVTVSFTTKKNV